VRAREGVEAVTATRGSLLYLLSLSAITLALAQWLPESGPLAFGLWATSLAAGLALGDLLTPYFEAIEEVRLGRLRVFGSIVYAGLLLLTFVKAIGTEVLLTAALVQVLAALQPAFLAFVGLSHGPGPVLVNAIALVFLAGLQGGPVSGIAAFAAVALLGTFLVFEHYSRVLTTYPAGAGRWVGLAWRDALRTVLPALLVVAVVLRIAPPVARSTEVVSVSGRHKDAVDWRILRSVIIIWIGGTTSVYVVGRFMRRRPDDSVATLEVLEPIRGPVERLTPVAAAPPPVTYPGLRGRIVQAYVRLRREAVRLGIPCPPHLTAHEFARNLGEPADRVASLTDTFVRARYGRAEPDELDALATEADAAAISAELHRRRSPRQKHPG
jgi:uncharacterized protein DUF4129